MSYTDSHSTGGLIEVIIGNGLGGEMVEAIEERRNTHM